MKQFYIKKVLFVALSFFFITLSTLFAQPSKEKAEKPESIHASVLNGPSGLWCAYMFENVPAVDEIPVDYQVCASPDVLLPKLLKGELDIGILPPNAAAKVYNKNNGAIIIGAVTGNGMLSVISKDDSVKTLSDLKGKTLYVAGQGSTPEYVIRYLLAKENIAVNTTDEDCVTLDFSIPASELAASVIADKALYALVPEPFSTVATTKSQAVKRVLNIQELWAAGENTQNFPMTTIVVRKEFAEKYPEVLKAYLAECKKAIEWSADGANAKEAGSLVEKHTLGLNAAIASKAMPNCAFEFTDAKNAKESVESLLSVFLQYAPESVGGALPTDEFYFE